MKMPQVKELQKFEASIRLGRNQVATSIVEAYDENEAAEKAALIFKQSLNIKIKKHYG